MLRSFKKLLLLWSPWESHTISLTQAPLPRRKGLFPTCFYELDRMWDETIKQPNSLPSQPAVHLSPPLHMISTDQCSSALLTLTPAIRGKSAVDRDDRRYKTEMIQVESWPRESKLGYRWQFPCTLSCVHQAPGSTSLGTHWKKLPACATNDSGI